MEVTSELPLMLMIIAFPLHIFAGSKQNRATVILSRSAQRIRKGDPTSEEHSLPVAQMFTHVEGYHWSKAIWHYLGSGYARRSSPQEVCQDECTALRASGASLMVEALAHEWSPAT